MNLATLAGLTDKVASLANKMNNTAAENKAVTFEDTRAVLDAVQELQREIERQKGVR